MSILLDWKIDMVIGSFIFNELKISNSCYMAAAIQFSTYSFI